MTRTALGFLKGLFNLKRLFNLLGTNQPPEERTYDITSLEGLRKSLEFRKNNPIYNGPWTVSVYSPRKQREQEEVRVTRLVDEQEAQALQSALYTEQIDSSLVFLKTDTTDRAMAISISGLNALKLLDLLMASTGWLLKYGERNSPLKALTSIGCLEANLGVPIQSGTDCRGLVELLPSRQRLLVTVDPAVITAYYTQKDGFGEDAPLREPV